MDWVQRVNQQAPCAAQILSYPDQQFQGNSQEAPEVERQSISYRYCSWMRWDFLIVTVRRSGRKRRKGEEKIYAEPSQNLPLNSQLRPVGEQAPLSVVDSNRGK